MTTTLFLIAGALLGIALMLRTAGHQLAGRSFLALGVGLAGMAAAMVVGRV